MAKDKSGSDGTTSGGAPISLIIKDPEKFAQNIAKMVEGMTRGRERVPEAAGRTAGSPPT
ncbi:MAG: hypothetical protein P0Y66_14095 [Candidatus Kaistia colombiensis]|nr:MAG: hypothetical protein P0Y66_14095 [Kaistia sp.]